MTPRRTKRAQLYEERYSSKLQEMIIIVSDDRAAKSLKNPQFVVYTKEEIAMLTGRPQELISICHLAKKLFNGTIVSITDDPQPKAGEKGMAQ